MSFAPSRSIVPPFAGHATSIRVCLAFLATLAALLPADALAQSRDLSTYVLFATERLRANGLRVVEGDVGVNHGALSSPRTLDTPASEVVADTVQILSTSRCARLFAGPW